MKIRIELTPAEAKALLTCAGEGYEGLARDPAAAEAHLGGARGIIAAATAIETLRYQLRRSQKPGEQR